MIVSQTINIKPHLLTPPHSALPHQHQQTHQHLSLPFPWHSLNNCAWLSPIPKGLFFEHQIKYSSFNFFHNKIALQIENMSFMKTSASFCHSGSVENYLNSPKMPVRDHMEGLKFTQSSFKKEELIVEQAVRKVLGGECASGSHYAQVMKMKQMKLVEPKQLSIVHHKSGKENSNIGSHHDRQTNPGYSRNKFGGFFTS